MIYAQWGCGHIRLVEPSDLLRELHRDLVNESWVDIRVLAERLRLIMPDHQGFGDNNSPEDFVYTFDSYAAVLRRFVRMLGLLTRSRSEIRAELA